MVETTRETLYNIIEILTIITWNHTTLYIHTVNIYRQKQNKQDILSYLNLLKIVETFSLKSWGVIYVQSDSQWSTTSNSLSPEKHLALYKTKWYTPLRVITAKTIFLKLLTQEIKDKS